MMFVSKQIKPLTDWLINFNNELLKKAGTSKSKSGYFLKVTYQFILTFAIARLIWPLIKYLSIVILGNNIFANLFDINLDNDLILTYFLYFKDLCADYIFKIRQIIAGNDIQVNKSGFSDNQIEKVNKLKDSGIKAKAHVDSLKSDSFPSANEGNRMAEDKKSSWFSRDSNDIKRSNYSNNSNYNDSSVTDNTKFYISILVGAIVLTTVVIVGYNYWDVIYAYFYSNNDDGSDGLGGYDSDISINDNRGKSKVAQQLAGTYKPRLVTEEDDVLEYSSSNWSQEEGSSSKASSSKIDSPSSTSSQDSLETVKAYSKFTKKDSDGSIHLSKLSKSLKDDGLSLDEYMTYFPNNLSEEELEPYKNAFNNYKGKGKA